MAAAKNYSACVFFRRVFLLICFCCQFTISFQLMNPSLRTSATQFPTQREQSHYAPSSAPSGSLSPGDYAALQAIKSALSDLPGSSFFSTWLSSPCATSSGVTCSPDSTDPTVLRVTSLELGTGLADSPGLQGTFPLAVTNLTALNQLVLFPGRVSGSLPTNIGEALPSLRFLSVTNNLISGPIPESLARLQQLHTLDLSGNRLAAPIPYGLFTLPALKTLILASNGGIFGPLPNIVTAPLLHLDLRDNAISGQLPTLLPTTLRYLSASDNVLSGPLDAVAALPALGYLDLSSNSFSGRIPPSLFSPTLNLLLLHHNNLSGALPTAAPSRAANSTDAADGTGWTVDVSHNMLSGPVTPALAGAESVSINDNRFVGPVPQEYTRSIYAGTMLTFYAQNNFLTSFPLPPGNAPLPPSASVCIAYNCMTTPAATSAGCPAAAGDYSAARAPSQCPVFGNATDAAVRGH